MNKELRDKTLSDISSISGSELEETLQAIGCGKDNSGSSDNNLVDEIKKEVCTTLGYCQVVEQYAYAITYLNTHILLDKIYGSKEEADTILRHLSVADRRLYDVKQISLRFVEDN